MSKNTTTPDPSTPTQPYTPAAEPSAAKPAKRLDGIAKAAQGVADGEPTAIDANRDGSWDVTLTGADAPQNVLDTATLQAMVDAALAEQPGRIIDIDADDDNRSRSTCRSSQATVRSWRSPSTRPARC